jgi:hypothetical protein
MSQPKPSFFIAIGAVVIALVGFAMWRFTGTTEDQKAQTQQVPKLSDADMADLQGQKHAEDPNQVGAATTVQK